MNTSNLCVAEIKDRKTRPNSPNRMDAIAYGVRARFEESTGYSKMIIDTTVNVAKTLGISEKEINQWTASHSTQLIDEAEGLKELKYLLERYYGNSFGINV